MKTITRWLAGAALCLLILAPDIAAQEKDRRLSGYVKLGGWAFDNFFWAPEGTPEDGVIAFSAEGGVRAAIREGSPIRAYVDAMYLHYDDFDPLKGVTVGLAGEGKPSSFDVSFQLANGRPSREVGDEFDRANVRELEGRYSYRANRHFEVSGLGEFRSETYELSPTKANDVYGLGASVRYRGFSHGFSPELGVGLGRRNVENENESLGQKEIWLKLRYAPARPLYLTMRVRLRFRNYSTEDATASNFEREDTRRQILLTADYEWSRRLVSNLYYSREGSDSTRASGRFSTQFVVLGLTVRL